MIVCITRSAVDVRTHFDPTKNFTSYFLRTFSFSRHIPDIPSADSLQRLGD